MGSGIRAILRNERYRGVVHWNASEWRKDPDTGRRNRVARPKEEWISHVDESIRIISDDLWERAQRRTRPAKNDARLMTGGKPKYLLSGLLRCDLCDAHYTITNATSYGCSSYHDGHACSNSILVRRDRAENILLGPIRDDLLKPERVARMAKEMQDYFSDRVRSMQTQALELPRELQELAARITRLREPLKNGDPDMPADELQAAIDRAEAKRRELHEQQLGANVPMCKALAIMPRAAELYRRQAALGLDGNPQAALKARLFLREWFGGKIRLEPLADGGLMAHWNQSIGALVSAGVGTYGSGGVL
jgi:site-specific DNA recombinase